MRIKTSYSRRIPILGANRRRLCSVVFVTALCAGTSLGGISGYNIAYANPEGGVVSGGSAQITQSGKKLDVHQHSNRAVIDWDSFDIDTDEHTEFHQPSSNAISLNRVKSSDPSRILGRLSANGNVIISNPSGVFFGKESRIDVNGIIATTADIETASFMSGSNDFNLSGNPDASIINEGMITAKEAGLVGLVAPNVENSGIIEAKLGRIHLASGDTLVADFHGDGLLKIAITDEAIKSQLVHNTGTLSAEGGTIAMTAASARKIIDSLIIAEGELKAPAIEQKNGRIIIGNAGDIGKTEINGNLNATGGGYVEVTGKHIELKKDTLIEASILPLPVPKPEFSQNGGEVLIGGDYQGQGEIFTAKTVKLEQGATVKANAGNTGNGGKVIIWSDDTTEFAGTIEAKGGEQSPLCQDSCRIYC